MAKTSNDYFLSIFTVEDTCETQEITLAQVILIPFSD